MKCPRKLTLRKALGMSTKRGKTASIQFLLVGSQSLTLPTSAVTVKSPHTFSGNKSVTVVFQESSVSSINISSCANNPFSHITFHLTSNILK